MKPQSNCGDASRRGDRLKRGLEIEAGGGRFSVAEADAFYDWLFFQIVVNYNLASGFGG